MTEGGEEDPRTACSSVADSATRSSEDLPSPPELVLFEDLGAVGGGVGEETAEDGDR
jgi:hypothetical protein